MALAPFISTEDLSDFLKRDVTGMPLAVIAVDSASQACRDVIQQPLNPTAGDIITLGSGGDSVLLLPRLPVTAVASVEQKGADDAWAEVPADDYVVDLEHGALVKMSGGWKQGRRNHRVTYSHGYAEVPTSIRIIALTIAARIYDQQLARQAGTGGVYIMYSASDSAVPTPREEALLKRYRKAR